MLIKTHYLRLDMHGIESLTESCATYALIDPLRMEQVLNNLLTNAVKYSPAGSYITIGLQVRSGLEAHQSTVYIYIADQGVMIPKEEQEQIFNRFYRSKKADNEVAGTGLGLAICKAIVRELHGEISVQSDPSGNRFNVALPVKSLGRQDE